MEIESEPKRGASVGIVIILLILLGGTFWFAIQKFNTPAPSTNLLGEELVRYSTSSPLRLSFSYSNSLFLEERQLGDNEGVYTQLVLTEDSEENRLLREGKAPPRDGPVAITIDVIDNRILKVPLETWILNDSRSNYGLATSALATTTVAGVSGFSYGATGLYESDNIAVSVGTHIIFLTVTYLTKDDSLRRVFIDTILPTLEVGSQ